MIKHNQNGVVNVLVLPLTFAIILFIVAASFAAWAYSSRQDYKNNTQAKISAAVAVAVQQESSLKDSQFQQQYKLPLSTYSGPEAYGSLVIKYPRTWSSYVDSTSDSQALVDGYFYPGTVPAITDTTNNFALRFQIIDQSYSDVLTALNTQEQQSGNITFSPYSPPKVPNVVGVRAEGSIRPDKVGSMIILPLRDTTLEIWTEAQTYDNDFNNNVLPNFSFSP